MIIALNSNRLLGVTTMKISQEDQNNHGILLRKIIWIKVRIVIIITLIMYLKIKQDTG